MSVKICSTCVSTVEQFKDFMHHCRKAQHFLEFYNEYEGNLNDIQSIRIQFELETQSDVKDEYSSNHGSYLRNIVLKLTKKNYF